MPADALLHLLLALATVIVAGRLLGVVFKWVGQPPVIGEVVAGILLGPSLLGWVWPEGYTYLLPQSVAPHLGMIAQLGVVLYMFCVGLELDDSHLKNRGFATLAISIASIVVPFLLGMAVAPALHAQFAPTGVRLPVFAIFLGAAMSVTAFPVLARILSDRGMTQTGLGALSLTCAAVNDVAAWCLLAFAIGVAQSEVIASVRVVSLAVAYIVFVFVLVRPAWNWLMRQPIMSQPSPTRLAIVLTSVLASALITELIGVHAIFGAFLFGAIIPHDSRIAKELAAKIEDVVVVLLLPAFFAFTGMRTQIGLVSGVDNWFWCGLIVAVAAAGKFGGTLAAARVTGLNWRESASLGALMNTRGLMELIVLNIGLDLGVISPTLYAMMVIMALATTLATSPALWLLGVTELEQTTAAPVPSDAASRKDATIASRTS